jgi:hypothetical protein
MPEVAMKGSGIDVSRVDREEDHLVLLRFRVRRQKHPHYTQKISRE